MQTLAFDPSLLTGYVSLHRTGVGVSPVRLPYQEADLFPSPDNRLMERARMPAGCRIAFTSDSTRLVVHATLPTAPEDPLTLDLTAEGELLSSTEVTGGRAELELHPLGPGAQRSYELWLPQQGFLSLTSLEIDDGATIYPAEDDRPRWITYGSSITQCRDAGSPARTWPATAARLLDLNLLNLGFGGECHLDSMVGRLIRDTPAAIITLKLGINVYGGSSLSARSYPAAVIGLVKLIREQHERTPVGVVTSIASPEREDVPNAAGCTLEAYREMTRDAVARLQKAGDRRILLFEGTDLLGLDEGDLLPDGLHPGPEGYEIMGRRAAERLLPRLLEMG